MATMRLWSDWCKHYLMPLLWHCNHLNDLDMTVAIASMVSVSRYQETKPHLFAAIAAIGAVDSTEKKEAFI